MITDVLIIVSITVARVMFIWKWTMYILTCTFLAGDLNIALLFVMDVNMPFNLVYPVLKFLIKLKVIFCVCNCSNICK